MLRTPRGGRSFGFDRVSRLVVGAMPEVPDPFGTRGTLWHSKHSISLVLLTSSAWEVHLIKLGAGVAVVGRRLNVWPLPPGVLS